MLCGSERSTEPEQNGDSGGPSISQQDARNKSQGRSQKDEGDDVIRTWTNRSRVAVRGVPHRSRAGTSTKLLLDACLRRSGHTKASASAR